MRISSTLGKKKVAGYINVDFRDGTGPSALTPNDVARAFREAENFAPVGRGAKFWAGATGADGAHHPGRAGGVQGGERGNSGRRGGTTAGRTRVVHVESATTGKFFKVRFGRETREAKSGGRSVFRTYRRKSLAVFGW